MHNIPTGEYNYDLSKNPVYAGHAKIGAMSTTGQAFYIPSQGQCSVIIVNNSYYAKFNDQLVYVSFMWLSAQIEIGVMTLIEEEEGIYK